MVACWRARGDTAVFSHYVAINAVVSHLLADDRVLAFRPDHTSITVLETDGDDAGAWWKKAAKPRPAYSRVVQL